MSVVLEGLRIYSSNNYHSIVVESDSIFKCDILDVMFGEGSLEIQSFLMKSILCPLFFEC